MYGKGSEGDRQRDSSVYSFFFSIKTKINK
jgi:hypothetical protein